MIAWLWYASILLFPLGQFGRVPIGQLLGVSNGVISAYELPLIVVVGFCLFKAGYRLVSNPRGLITQISKSHLGRATTAVIMLLTVSWLASLLTYTFEQNLVAGLYLARLLLYISLVFLVVSGSLQRMIPSISLHGTKRCTFASLGIIIGIGLIQYFWYPDLGNLFYLGWDPHLHRLFGSFLEPVMLAAILGVSIWFSIMNHLSHTFRIGLIASLIGGIILTFSRAAYLALMVSGGWFLLQRRRFILLISSIAVFGIGLTVFVIFTTPEGEGLNLLRTATIASRVTNYQEGLQTWQTAPILGIGYNHIGSNRDRVITPESAVDRAAYSYHSSFLMILVTTGVGGLAAYLYWLWSIARRHTFFAGTLLFLAVVALFDNVLLHPFILFWISATGSAVTPLSRE